MIIALLVGIMETGIGKLYMLLSSTKVVVNFQGNILRYSQFLPIFGMNPNLWHAKEWDIDVTT